MSLGIKCICVVIVFVSLSSLIFYNNGDDYFTFLHGKKQHVLVQGKGEPTVVFITGKGRLYTDFKKVYSEIKNTTQIFAYDRAGLGLSEPLRTERRVDTMANELYALLAKEKINPPYILVGHSMGCYIARCFANNYPTSVKGMVFVEPANEHEYMYALSIRNDSDKIEFKNQFKTYITTKGISKGQKAESKLSFDLDTIGYSTNQRIVKDLPLPIRLPITIILSLVPDAENNYIDKETNYKVSFFEDWKIHNPHIKVLTTTKSGYFIQKEEPSLVIKEIKEMLLDK